MRYSHTVCEHLNATQSSCRISNNKIAPETDITYGMVGGERWQQHSSVRMCWILRYEIHCENDRSSWRSRGAYCENSRLIFLQSFARWCWYCFEPFGHDEHDCTEIRTFVSNIFGRPFVHHSSARVCACVWVCMRGYVKHSSAFGSTFLFICAKSFVHLQFEMHKINDQKLEFTVRVCESELFCL